MMEQVAVVVDDLHRLTSLDGELTRREDLIFLRDKMLGTGRVELRY